MIVTVVLICVIAGLIAGAFLAECRLCRKERTAGEEIPTDTTTV